MPHFKRWCFLLICLEVFITSHATEDQEYHIEVNDDPSKFKLVVDKAKEPRYLLYDVNPGEGFNLRRDVYMRIAVLVNNLNKDEPWILVLPPWGRIYHWRSRDIGYQSRIPWSTFFDIASLREFVPVIEFEEFLKISKEPVIDELYYLQNYKEGWKKFEEKMDFRPCIHNPYHQDSESKKWHGWFFGYEDDVFATNMKCISVLGHASIMKNFLISNTTARSVMLDRAEVLIHDHYGDANFWKCRRSMRFARHLRVLGDIFRMQFLDSTDEEDGTMLEEDWTKMKRNYGDAVGGPYLAVHLRRADFVKVRSKDTPSLSIAADQIEKLLKKLNLKKVFIATDAPKEEFATLSRKLEKFEVYKFQPSKDNLKKYGDGGMAIIDQWIAAHARHFIGTRESTFSFRIQDEREILGFRPETTFNRLCTQKGEDCEQPSQWKIVY